MTLPAAVRVAGTAGPAVRSSSPGRLGEASATFNNFRQTEIRHLHPAAAIQQDVFRLDVAMDDALVVRELERITNLRDNGQRLARGNATGVQAIAAGSRRPRIPSGSSKVAQASRLLPCHFPLRQMQA